MALRRNLETVPVWHPKKGKLLVNKIDLVRFLEKNKDFSDKEPVEKKSETKKEKDGVKK